MSKNAEAKPEAKPEVLESDKILADINALKKGKTPPPQVIEKTEEKPKESPTTTSDKAPKPTMEKEPAPTGNAEETKAPDDKKTGKPEVDIREWAKRKGIKENDTDSVLKAYREAERKISQLQAEAKKEENVPHGTPPWQPTPQMAPQWTPPPYYPPQGYPPPYMDRKAIIEQEAARFNIPIEDFERILPLVNEVTDLKMNRERQALQARYDAQLAELSRDNRRSNEFNQLMVDPLFTSEPVAFEIDQLLNENPSRLKLEPTPWTNMFQEALQRIARKSLQPNNEVESTSNSTPTSPPKEGGRGSSPSVPHQNSSDLLEKFKDLDAKEMEKQLASIGAIPPR